MVAKIVRSIVRIAEGVVAITLASMLWPQIPHLLLAAGAALIWLGQNAH